MCNTQDPMLCQNQGPTGRLPEAQELFFKEFRRSRLQKLASVAQEKVLQRFPQLLLIFQALTVCSVCSEHVLLQTEPSTRSLRSESNIPSDPAECFVHSLVWNLLALESSLCRIIWAASAAIQAPSPLSWKRCFLMNVGSLISVTVQPLYKGLIQLTSHRMGCSCLSLMTWIPLSTCKCLNISWWSLLSKACLLFFIFKGNRESWSLFLFHLCHQM